MYADAAARRRMQSRFTVVVAVAALLAAARTAWFVAALAVWLPHTTTAYTLLFHALAPLGFVLLVCVLFGVSRRTGDRVAESGTIQGLAQMPRVSTVSPTLAWWMRLAVADALLLLVAVFADAAQYAHAAAGSDTHLVWFIVADALAWAATLGSLLLTFYVGVCANREAETPTAQMRMSGRMPPPLLGGAVHRATRQRRQGAVR
jgi:hypothetical protein